MAATFFVIRVLKDWVRKMYNIWYGPMHWKVNLIRKSNDRFLPNDQTRNQNVIKCSVQPSPDFKITHYSLKMFQSWWGQGKTAPHYVHYKWKATS